MLSTVERLKKAIGIPEVDTSQDDMLMFYLQASSTAIETYCKRIFGRSTHTGTFDGPTREYLLVPNYPIVEIISATSDGQPITDYEIDHERGMLFRPSWPSGERVISLEYTAGYILPKDGTAAAPSDLPKSIEYACILLSQVQMRGSAGVKAERVGDISVTYEDEGESLPKAVKALVGPYVNRYV